MECFVNYLKANYPQANFAPQPAPASSKPVAPPPEKV